LDDIFWEKFGLNLKVLVSFCWSAKVEVFDVNGHEFCVECRYDAIEKELDW
jgi:hypothetical protein